MPAERKTFWMQTLLQAAVMLVAAAVAWGYQKAEIATIRAEIARVDTQGPAAQREETARTAALASKIDALTVEVKYLHEMIQEVRDARVYHK